VPRAKGPPRQHLLPQNCNLLKFEWHLLAQMQIFSTVLGHFFEQIEIIG
jgi:hypothetical protein